ncbi:MAG: trk system potassium uptake protein TrkA, partial [Candidatus Azotimanducaceae bacterium]
MKIVILGAGQVGGTLAESLAKESFDISLVDSNAERLQTLADRLDIQTTEGWASHPDVLRRAGADDADIIVAVTSSDEVNMIACQVSYSLFRTPIKIARVRSSTYLSREGFFSKEHMPIDVLINPEQVVTDHISELLRHPGALQVLDFADGRVQLVAMRAYYGGPLVGQALSFLRKHMPRVDTRVAAIFRRGKPIIPKGNTVIEVDDEVFFIAAREHIDAVMGELRKVERPFKRIMIAGGGNIGASLADALEDDYNVKIIEYTPARAKQLADQLDKTVVLQGDA